MLLVECSVSGVVGKRGDRNLMGTSAGTVVGIERSLTSGPVLEEEEEVYSISLMRAFGGKNAITEREK